ncbi:TioE family transcriptional regulator [Streptomyces roseirectus]|uniref:TioE family transcriptional regulator n=1 Tax=Streptomyces roseirectus TaxID=2768066 RepID=A0A7H0IRN5_9ACTN|nr:TioE family transcriptional regulator [Streptomyces roseirectus]QNP75451.1 TioE family transcriptional regulator [Streptomyces roseirectus]
MGRDLQSGVRLRPVDLARAHGLSAQAVRNYERDGILPVAERTASGYRVYTPVHARALGAFLALVPGHGHATAAAIMRAVNSGDVEGALRLVDGSHAQLLEDRRTLEAVEGAVRDLTPVPLSEPGGVFVGVLAARLGVRAATLRKWERAGLVRPERDPVTGYRVYGEVAVRDALLVRQLRRGGYLLERIAPVVSRVREAGGVEPLQAVLGEWRARLTVRGRALLGGAAELEGYVRVREGGS